MELKINKKYILVLGSQSPRRKELLGWLNVPFVIQTAELEEISNEDDPREVAMDLASQKAHAVFNNRADKDSSFVISSDTIVVLDEKIYNKPKDSDEARKILLELSMINFSEHS